VYLFRIGRVTRQVDDLRFVEPSQLLHDSDPGVKPGDIATRQNLPRALDAASEAITHTGGNVRIEEMRRLEVRNQHLVDHVCISRILGGICDLDQILELFRCYILDLVARRGNRRRWY